MLSQGGLRPWETNPTMKTLHKSNQRGCGCGENPNIVFGKRNGFSLLELLVVVGVTALMLSLMSPVMEGLTSARGRKGGVTIVMNTLELARVSAIEKGRDVVVVFWKKNGTPGVAIDEADAMIVLRKNDADTDWEPITRWVQLPKGVLLHGEDGQSHILKDSAGLGVVNDATLENLPGSPDKQDLGGVHFTKSGSVQSPNNASGLRIAITEGQRDGEGRLAVDRQKAGGYEVISIARFTGRVSLEITNL